MSEIENNPDVLPPADGSHDLEIAPALYPTSPMNRRVSKGVLKVHQGIEVTFGVLFNDDKCANIFEALVGTLRAAKKRKVLKFEGELLLQGVHDNVEIILQPEPAAKA